MTAKRKYLSSMFLLLVGALVLGLVSCQSADQEGGGQGLAVAKDQPIFGNGFIDKTPVLCRIGGQEITEKMLRLRYEELPRSLKSRFSGEGWEKRFLRYMVDELLLTQAAVERKLYLEPQIMQNLISTRRSALKTAMRDIELIKGIQPTEERIQQHYEQSKIHYKRQGTMHARHIQCNSREAAQDAYDRLRRGGWEGGFGYVVADYSVNEESAKLAGDLGWFNKNGFIPALPYGKEFSAFIWDWEPGLHEPFEFQGDWHVLEILGREYERLLTLDEARDQIVRELQPIVEEEAVDDWLRQRKQEVAVEYFGDYRPGQGLNPRELFERAWYANTPEQQLDYFKMLLDDYPDSDLVDDALFMMAQIHLDRWGELAIAARYLKRLLDEHPDSELSEDARYIMDNMGKPGFMSPKAIEDVKQVTGDD
jgi:hypothetical protein